MTEAPKLTTADLRQFTGTERWFRHWYKRDVLYTEGVQYMAEQAGAYWLIDEIALAQHLDAIRAEDFQVWTLVVHEDRSATLQCGDGSGRNVHTKQIDFTDFPMKAITLWFAANVIYLPSEH